VAAKLHMSDKVTPRSIAYAAVQVSPHIMNDIIYSESISSAYNLSSFILLSRRPPLGVKNITALVTELFMNLLLITSKKLKMKPRTALMSFSSGGRCKSNYFTSLSTNSTDNI
jgi:hypothetical protein